MKSINFTIHRRVKDELQCISSRRRRRTDTSALFHVRFGKAGLLEEGHVYIQLVWRFGLKNLFCCRSTSVNGRKPLGDCWPTCVTQWPRVSTCQRSRPERGSLRPAGSPSAQSASGDLGTVRGCHRRCEREPPVPGAWAAEGKPLGPPDTADGSVAREDLTEREKCAGDSQKNTHEYKWNEKCTAGVMSVMYIHSMLSCQECTMRARTKVIVKCGRFKLITKNLA